MNPWDWVGPVAAIALIAAVALVRGVTGLWRRRGRLAVLLDLSRDDVDPDWERVRRELGPDPRK